MSFYNGELKTFDLCRMYEKIEGEFFVNFCDDGVSKSFDKKLKDEVINNLKKYGELYYSFGRRVGKYLSCANGRKYKVDDDRSLTSEGIYMSDSYFNEYDDKNIGFLVSYEYEKITIQPAIEGESIRCRRCEVIEDCGDLHTEMRNFLEDYII